MPRALATDSLNSEARSLMVACFRNGMTAAATAAKLKAEAGVEVAARTIGRRKAEWEVKQAWRQEQIERAQVLLEAADRGDYTAAGMVKALAMEALLRNPERFSEADPIEVQKQALRAEEIGLRREQMQFNIRKFEAMQRREQKAIETAAALEQKAASGQTVTPEEIRKIREVYGLQSSEAA